MAWINARKNCGVSFITTQDKDDLPSEYELVQRRPVGSHPGEVGTKARGDERQ